MSNDYVQVVLKVSANARAQLRQFAQEDRRNLSREFENLMEQESARRLAQYKPVKR